jgi:hypothetical protein
MIKQSKNSDSGTHSSWTTLVSTQLRGIDGGHRRNGCREYIRPEMFTSTTSRGRCQPIVGIIDLGTYLGHDRDFNIRGFRPRAPHWGP